MSVAELEPKVSVKAGKGLERKLTVTVPAEEIDKLVEKRIEELAKNKSIKVQGFRPGQVPLSEVKRRYGESAREEVISDVIRDSLYKAIVKEDLNPAGSPQIEETKIKAGEPLEYVAAFEIYPEVELKDLSKLKVERPTAELADSDVDKVLEHLSKQHADWDEVDAAAKSGDKVVIDFTGSIDGEEFPGGSAKEYGFEIGAGQMLADFEKGIEGAKPGADLKVNVKFPEKYDPKLAGKTAEFAIHVHKVMQAKPPKLDDEFAKKFGIDTGLKGLREQISKNLEQGLANKIKSVAKKDVMDKLADANKFDVPSALVKQEAEHMQKESSKQFQQAGNENALPIEMFEEEAKRRVSLSLIIHEILKKFEIKLDEARLESTVKELSQGYEKPEEFVKWYYEDQTRLAGLQTAVLEDQVVDKVLESAKVTEKKYSYDDLMKL